MEPLLADQTINDILVNGYKQVFVERYGRLELTSVRFKDNAHLKKVIERIVATAASADSRMTVRIVPSTGLATAS